MITHLLHINETYQSKSVLKSIKHQLINSLAQVFQVDAATTILKTPSHVNDALKVPKTFLGGGAQ